MTQYLLTDGRRVFVRAGLGDDPEYKAFFVKPKKDGRYGNPHALPSRNLPWRNTEETAQMDLDDMYHANKGIFKNARIVGQDCAEICNGKACCNCPFREGGGK